VLRTPSSEAGPGLAAPERVAAIISTGSGLTAIIDLHEDEAFRFAPATRAVMLEADVEAMIASQAVEPVSEGVSDLDSFAVPALLIAGELEDPGGEATVIAGRLPHGESLILPGLGHAAACAASALTIPTARAFLDRWFAQPG